MDDRTDDRAQWRPADQLAPMVAAIRRFPPIDQALGQARRLRIFRRGRRNIAIRCEESHRDSGGGAFFGKGQRVLSQELSNRLVK